jgi:hypothetical protein
MANDLLLRAPKGGQAEDRVQYGECVGGRIGHAMVQMRVWGFDCLGQCNQLSRAVPDYPERINLASRAEVNGAQNPCCSQSAAKLAYHVETVE